MPSHDSLITESPGTPDVAITEAHVYAAIADVLDPELDEPLVIGRAVGQAGLY